MGVSNKSASQPKADSVEKTSEASTSWSTMNDSQSNKMLAEKNASISKGEVVIKQEDHEVLTTDVFILQNTESESVDSVVTSTNESNSSESQKDQELSEPYLYDTSTLAGSELEDSEVCMSNTSHVQDSKNTAALTSQLNSHENPLAEIPSEKTVPAAEESKTTFSIGDSKSHRQNIHYSSESSDYETESSDSSDSDEFFENLHRSVVAPKLPVLKTKGELSLEDLPPVEDLHITVNSTELLKIGFVLHWVVIEEHKEFLVIVQSDGNSNPLDEDSVLFLSSDKPLGKIHDVFGNVSKPNYVIRFNKAEDIFNKGITMRQSVFYSPSNGELTRYVLVDVLKQQKGSDASWKDNNEPPDEEIDYSDDEQEKLAKQKRRAKTRGKERNWNDGEVKDVTPNKMERRENTNRQKRVFKRASRNVFQSPVSGPSRSSPRPYSPQNFGPVPPPSDNFNSPGLRNAISPQPFGLTPSNSVPFLQRNVPSPQSFGPFPHSNTPSPQPFGSLPQNNVPPPQLLGSLQHSNVSTPQRFGSLPHSNVPPPQRFGSLPYNNVSHPQRFGSLPLNNVLPPQRFGSLPHNNAPPQRFGLLPHNNVLPPQHFGSLPYSNVPSPQTFTIPPTSYVLASNNPAPSYAVASPQLNSSSLMAVSHNNIQLQQQLFLQRSTPSPQPFGSFPHSNVPSPQTFGTLPHSNVSSPQSFGSFPHRNVQSPQPLGPFPHNVSSPQPFGSFAHSNVSSPQTFGTLPNSSISPHQTFTVPSTYVLATHNIASSHAAASQLNSSSLMAAPQNNIPLQQQLLLQPQQPISNFVSFH